MELVTTTLDKPSFDSQLQTARRMLAEVQTVSDAVHISDVAEAIRTYAKRVGLGLEAQNHAAEIKIRAERRAGELVRDIPKQAGSRGVGKKVELRNETPLLADLGIKKIQSHRWQKVASIPDNDFEQVIQELTGRGKELTTKTLLSLSRLKEAKKPYPVSEVIEGAFITVGDWMDWLTEQPDCDLLLTDPPYSTDVDDVERFASEWLPLALTKLKPTARAYVFIGAYPEELRAYLNIEPLPAQVLVWTYRNTLGPSPSLDYKLNWQAILYYRGPEVSALDSPSMVEQFSVQDVNAPDGRRGDRYHAWQKPLDLAERLVRHSTTEGDLVLDPFAGTGTFLLAAAKHGRRGLGCERDPEMVEIATSRGCQIA